MNEHELRRVPLAEIDVSGRLRVIDEAHAMLLAENIKASGRLRQPVEIRPRRGGGYQLIAGGHRLRAVGMLGWDEIDAFILDVDDDEAKLAEIDENLVRHDLNPLDRAVFLAERKAVWLRMHPETAAGVAGGMARQGAATDIMSFARDTAERCGITERTVQRAVMIADKLSPDIRARIAGTWIARKQSELLDLVKTDPDKRLPVLDLLLDEDSTLTSVKGALRSLDDGAPSVADDRSKAVAALRKAWDRASLKDRTAWIDEMISEGRGHELQGFVWRGKTTTTGASGTQKRE